MRLVVALMIFAGCVTTPEIVTPPSETKPVDACAALRVAPPPESCEQLSPQYGLDEAHPLEWALLGTFPGLYRELVCADGTDVVLGDAKGSFDAPQPRSTSPRGGMAVMASDDSTEFLDSWTVTCGAQKFSIVTNAYRCGNPCPPRGLARVPPVAAAALERGEKAMKENLVGDARKAFAEAAKLAPNLERVWRWVGFAASRDGAFDEAHRAYQTAQQIAPNEPYYELVDALLTARQGDNGPLKAKVDELLARLPENDRLRPQVLCRKAELLQESEPAKAVELAKESCAAGFKQCCE